LKAIIKSALSSEISVFLRQLLQNPRHVGAFVPSGKALARKMTCDLHMSTGHVVELGAGTGRISRAILAAGVPPANLTLLEMNPVFCAALKRSFPATRVVNCMAQDLPELGLDGVTSVISGLPMLNMSKQAQNAIVSSVFKTLSPDGMLVQFTYGLRPPLADEVIRDNRLCWSKRDRVWANVPPADVYVFRREKPA